MLPLVNARQSSIAEVGASVAAELQLAKVRIIIVEVRVHVVVELQLVLELSHRVRDHHEVREAIEHEGTVGAEVLPIAYHLHAAPAPDLFID